MLKKLFYLMTFNLFFGFIFFLIFHFSYNSIKEVRYYKSFNLIQTSKQDEKTKKQIFFINRIHKAKKEVLENEKYIKVFFNHKKEWVQIEKYALGNKLIFKIERPEDIKIDFFEKII